MSEADPEGVGERPDTDTMQNAVDALRRLLVGDDQPRQLRDATVRMGADMLELAIDWLADQHRMISALQQRPEALMAELEATAHHYERAHQLVVKQVGGNMKVGVRDPLALADLLRRAMEGLSHDRCRTR